MKEQYKEYKDLTELDIDLKLEILNKLNQLKNTIEALGFFSLATNLILITYIITKGF